MTDRTCSACDRPVKARGMCQPHYRAWIKSPEGQAAPKMAGRPRKTPTPCSVEACERPARSFGMCDMHRRRVKRSGRVDLLSVEDRFFERVAESPSGCWEWQGYINPKGYGGFAPTTDKPVEAHRWAYQFLIGPVPDGLHLDHLCRNRACVNPWHMEPVTLGVNILRGVGPSALNARKTRCIRGHKFDATNTYVTPDGRRMCRTCQRYRSRRYEASR